MCKKIVFIFLFTILKTKPYAACPDGYYGDNCNQLCSVIPNCDLCTLYSPYSVTILAQVIKTLSCTKCLTGHTGKNCTESCSVNCKGNVCDRLSGVCHLGCKAHFYGEHCNKKCPVGCGANSENVTSCNKTSGVCDYGCQDGFYGLFCDKKCNDDCMTEFLNKSVCDASTGMCVYGCRPGLFGSNCTNKCPQNCVDHDEKCNQLTGECSSCKGGFYGSTCDTNCSKNCMTDSSNKTVCHMSNGTCIYGCKPSYFGLNCTHKCSVNCAPNGICNQLTGECSSCKDGFYGSSCDNNCSDNCSDPMNCNKSTGECINGCKVGYFGSTCDSVCNLNCIANKTCRQNDEVCGGCRVGFHGAVCDIRCSENCGGDGRCMQSGGSCDSGCAPGYFGSSCTEMCPTRCEPNNTCHRETGYCLGCMDGFHGNRCLQACPVNCSTDRCSQSNGHCMHGCRIDMFGSKCSKLCDCSGERCDQTFGKCTNQVEKKDMLVIYVSASVTGFVVLAVVAGIVVCLCRHYLSKRMDVHNEMLELRHGSYDRMNNFYSQRQNDSHHASTDIVRTVVQNAGMLIKRSEIINDKEIIGRGNFAEVRKGKLAGAPFNEFVAIKTIQALHTPKDFMDFQKELEIIGTIGYNPNVVALKGFCVDDETDCIGAVLEYCPNGDLKTYLRKLKSPNDLDDEHRTLVYRQFVKFTIDVANGMKHISDIGIIHRDLAARNVLLDGGLIAKVSDFGLSRIQKTYTMKNENVELPLKWMALESLRDLVFTTASDVWSFGVVMWEIYSVGATPFPHESSDNIQIKLDLGVRLQKPEYCDQEIYNLMLECWNSDPTCRPSFTGLYERLVGYMDKIMGDEYQEIQEDKDNYNKIKEAVIRDYEKCIDDRRFLPNADEILETELDQRETSPNLDKLHRNNTTIDELEKVNEVYKNENIEFAQRNSEGRNSHRDSYITPTHDNKKEEENIDVPNDEIDQYVLGRRKSHRDSYITPAYDAKKKEDNINVPNDQFDQDSSGKIYHIDSYITPQDMADEEIDLTGDPQYANINRRNQISGVINPHRSSYLTAVDVVDSRTGNFSDEGIGNTNEDGNGNSNSDESQKMNGFLSNINCHRSSYFTPQNAVETETGNMDELSYKF